MCCVKVDGVRVCVLVVLVCLGSCMRGYWCSRVVCVCVCLKICGSMIIGIYMCMYAHMYMYMYMSSASGTSRSDAHRV